MRENFKFSMVPNVPANAEFFYLKDSTITCKRIGKSEKVRYNYGEYSLSAAAIAAYKSFYGKDTSLCGPEYWLYDGKTLNEWRVENEQKKADKIVAEHVTVARSLLSIKKFIDFIENYPIVSLKNWGDTFYGYPEEVLEKMWNMVDNSKEEKLKKKICVLDDFGLQVHKFLIKKGVSPENIYFCISNEDESFLEIVKAVYSKLANSDRICSIFSLKNVFGDNNMFDLIIANPPYGDKSSLCKRISNIVYLCAETCIVLEPFGGVENCYSCCESFERIKEPWKLFPDAGISNLNIFKLKPRAMNDFKTLEDFVNKDNWFGEYLKLNRSRKAVYDRRTANVKCKEQKLDEKRIFYLPNWLVQHIASHGPLIDKSLDNLHNVYGAKIDWNTPSVRTSGDRFIYFKSRTEFRNFRRWVYKEKRLFTKICERMWFVGNKAEFEKFLPHVDWSHPWTDQEILKEIGLPEGFLEDNE